MTQAKYELTFRGGATAAYFPRYRRAHSTLESAKAAADKVRATLESKGLPTNGHQPIVFGPGCGDGKTWLW